MHISLLALVAFILTTTARAITLAGASSSTTAAPAASGQWAIRHFRRFFLNENVTQYEFQIDTGRAPLVGCKLVDAASPVARHAFYARPCGSSTEWAISWGWERKNDFTVMTVVYKPNGTEAFFGYDHPNEGLRRGGGFPLTLTYADKGPNPVLKISEIGG